MRRHRVKRGIYRATEVRVGSVPSDPMDKPAMVKTAWATGRISAWAGGFRVWLAGVSFWVRTRHERIIIILFSNDQKVVTRTTVGNNKTDRCRAFVAVISPQSNWPGTLGAKTITAAADQLLRACYGIVDVVV